MKNVKIKYNPFTKTTDVLVDGKKPKSNSSLNFGEKRLQEWAGELPEILVRECQDRNFSIEFTGTLADFEDLKSGLSAPNVGVKIDNYKHNCTPSVSETEEEVDKIFKEIKNGPVPQLRDQSIITAFEKAKNLRFEINVVATMSSGKSTLINALLDKKLMPVANEATTATIVNIIDTDIPNYRGVAYNSEDKELFREENLTYSKMKEWNAHKEIFKIDIEGRIPCVNSIGMKLVLVDTPGPNNSADTSHRAMTYNMLDNSDKSLVLFVMRADSLDVDDEKVFLDYVCECMKKGGKQSRDRYIFAINKIDLFNPEEESVEGALVKQKNKLEHRGIFNPNIFPVSAQAALEARTKPVLQQVLPVYKQYIKHFPSTHYDSYYQFSHLPNLIRIEIEKYLEDAEKDKEEGEYTAIEIHSGVVSIEKAIELYINKYARTIKVYDLVQSFNNRLKDLAAIATLEEEIKKDTNKKEDFDNSINVLRSKIQSGESARQWSKLVDDIDIKDNVQKEIDDYINSLLTKINGIIYDHTNSSEIERSEADIKAKEIERESKDILGKLSSQIDKILSNTYRTLFRTIVNQYKHYMKELGVAVEGNSLSLNPLDFIAENIADLSSVLDNKTKPKPILVGSHTEYEWVTESYQHRLTNWFWNPDDWFTERYETRYHDVLKPKEVKDYKSIDYVNMADVVNTYFEPIQIALNNAKESAMQHVASETSRIKNSLKKQLKDINSALDKKLNELQNAINNANETKAELNRKKQNLIWMNGIITRINKLINF